MRSLSEIDTLSKRASKGMGFSWGISEEIGKSIKLMEMFGLPGLKNLNNYFKVIKKSQFQNISLITETNISNKIPYCPLITGINFMDQIYSLEKYNKIIFNNMAYPILLIPFISRSSEIIGKRLKYSKNELSKSEEELKEFSEKKYSYPKIISQKILNLEDLYNRGHYYTKIDIDQTFPNFFLNNPHLIKDHIL